jgi:hypothetical protein
LLDLARLSDRTARRSSWRQSIVSLGQATSQHGPGPLEGIDPAALVPAVRAALTDGLVDDLDWLSAEAAAVALYEIASALPQGLEKREVGRRVAAYTYDGSADTFAAVGTRMALGSGKGLAGPPVRARIALALEVPSDGSTRVDALALALASRRDLIKEWIAKPSRGSLPARRLAGRLIERAAGEAARLAAQGDEHAPRAFRGEALTKAYQDLLWDREPLVWRHGAVARGLLAGVMPDLAAEIESHLGEELSPTQWRRAATSLGAAIGIDPARVIKRAHELLASKILEIDHGVASCLVFGLAHGAKVEPDAAEELLSSIVVREGSSIAEAFEEGAREERGWYKSRACQLLRRDLVLHLKLFGARADDGNASLAIEILRDLDPKVRPERPARQGVEEALAAFGTTGARRAHELAVQVAAVARERVALLEATPSDLSSEARRGVFALLRDLDISLLESATLPNLLALDRRPADATTTAPAFEELNDRMGRIFLGWEGRPLEHGERPSHPSVRLRTLRALIHVLDVDADETSESKPRATTVHRRWLSATHTVMRRLVEDPPSVFRRSLAAALARALEGLVRAEDCDPVDTLLFVAHRLDDPEHFQILGEAARAPDLIALLQHYEAYLRADQAAQRPLEAPPSATADASLSVSPLSISPLSIAPALKDELARRIDALTQLARDLSGENSSREEALRAVLVRLARALSQISEATSLGELAPEGRATDSALTVFEEAAGSLAQLVTSARRRFPTDDDGALESASDVDARISMAPRVQAGALARALDRALAGQSGVLAQPVDDLQRFFRECLPVPMASLVAAALDRVADLPRASRKGATTQQETLLPSWLPARRTLGGFFVLRSLGKGGVGSVFVAKRIEERNDPKAEMFALKVPEFDAQVARHMSEADFLRMFQSEASALLSLPSHKNLARFVTFDLGLKPKPILVMELVDGVTLEMLIARRQLTTERALGLLDGLFAGLEAMHGVGVAHLDLKPTNVVMRQGTEPVLVDFGLAGRHLRLGCGSGPYGAPEVWGLSTGDDPVSPTTADVYAAACLTYETLTTQPLFDQTTEMALVKAHMSHDGWPTPLRSWYQQKPVAEVARLVGLALRRDPRDRIDITAFRKQLAELASKLTALPWPLSP